MPAEPIVLQIPSDWTIFLTFSFNVADEEWADLLQIPYIAPESGSLRLKAWLEAYTEESIAEMAEIGI